MYYFLQFFKEKFLKFKSYSSQISTEKRNKTNPKHHLKEMIGTYKISNHYTEDLPDANWATDKTELSNKTSAPIVY